MTYTQPKPYVDPNELPSDARMIDWVERRRYRVEPVCTPGVSRGWEVQESYRNAYDLWEYRVMGYGDTWRQAVEEAMKNSR